MYPLPAECSESMPSCNVSFAYILTKILMFCNYLKYQRKDTPMTPKSIGSVLKYYRKLRNLSVNDVSLYLSENNSSASPKTIYGWENDHTEPNLHTLVLLCHLYPIPSFAPNVMAVSCVLSPSSATKNVQKTASGANGIFVFSPSSSSSSSSPAIVDAAK